MGVFDYVEFPSGVVAQVKTWNRTLSTYRLGDSVPTTNSSSHSIKTLEGFGWINICNKQIVSFTEKPFYFNLFDKWGQVLSSPGDYNPSPIELILNHFKNPFDVNQSEYEEPTEIDLQEIE